MSGQSGHPMDIRSAAEHDFLALMPKCVKRQYKQLRQVYEHYYIVALLVLKPSTTKGKYPKKPLKLKPYPDGLIKIIRVREDIVPNACLTYIRTSMLMYGILMWPTMMPKKNRAIKKFLTTLETCLKKTVDDVKKKKKEKTVVVLQTTDKNGKDKGPGVILEAPYIFRAAKENKSCKCTSCSDTRAIQKLPISVLNILRKFYSRALFPHLFYRKKSDFTLLTYGDLHVNSEWEIQTVKNFVQLTAELKKHI